MCDSTAAADPLKVHTTKRGELAMKRPSPCDAVALADDLVDGARHRAETSASHGCPLGEGGGIEIAAEEGSQRGSLADGTEPERGECFEVGSVHGASIAPCPCLQHPE